MIEVIGDVVLALSIICGAVIFTVANINYLPDDDEEN